MKLGRDLAAGIGASFWSMAVALAAVPVFIAYLGVEAYGLIGFSTALQSFLMLLDLGLAPTISREVARASVSGRMAEVRNLIRSMAWIYWAVAAVIAAALVALAPFVARDWLNPGVLSPATLSSALTLMGLQIAFRWPSGLYLSALMGAHRLVLASAVSAAYFTVANLGAIVVLAFWEASIEAFFLWQAIAGLGYTFALQRTAWNAVGGSQSARLDKKELKRIWRFSAKMSGVALVSIVITQLDKIILSKVISLESFGHYMLAVLAVSILYRVTTPLFNTIYPRFSALIANHREAELGEVYRITSNLFAIFWFPGIMMMAVCSHPLLLLWTGDAAIASRAAPLLTLLALGTGLHGTMFFPYALQLAYGETRLTLNIHLLLLAVQLPLIVVLALRYGVRGGAVAWLILYVVYVTVATPMTHRRLLPGLGRKWLFTDLGRPFLATVPFGVAGILTLPWLTYSPIRQVIAGAGLLLLAMLTSFLLSPHKPAQIKAVLAS